MRDGYKISTDDTKLDVAIIHDFLCNRSYWGKGRTVESVRKTIDNSLCFGIYDEKDHFLGFARVVTDFTIFAYLMDVFILEAHRGSGVGKKLLQFVFNYPDLMGIKAWRLDTDDAHELYKKYGFKEPAYPEKIMEKRQITHEGTP